MFKQIDKNARSERWAQLMERSQRGDREAFRSLVNEIGPVIAHLLRRELPMRAKSKTYARKR